MDLLDTLQSLLNQQKAEAFKKLMVQGMEKKMLTPVKSPIKQEEDGDEKIASSKFEEEENKSELKVVNEEEKKEGDPLSD